MCFVVGSISLFLNIFVSENVMVLMSLEVNCLGYFRFNSLFSNVVVVAI